MRNDDKEQKGFELKMSVLENKSLIKATPIHTTPKPPKFKKRK
jgi:hypothetical protein